MQHRIYRTAQQPIKRAATVLRLGARAVGQGYSLARAARSGSGGWLARARSGRERTRLTTRWQLPPARRNLSGTAFMSGCISMTSIMEVSSTTNRSQSSGLSSPRLKPPPLGSSLPQTFLPNALIVTAGNFNIMLADSHAASRLSGRRESSSRTAASAFQHKVSRSPIL